MTKGTFAFITLGCDKNRVDSEVMCGLLQEAGFLLVPEEAEADLLIVNTCAFIEDALTESIETIVEAGQWKQNGRLKGIVVAGCLGQRYEKELFDELPEVDAIVGTAAFAQIADVAERLLAGETRIKILEDIDTRQKDELGNKRVLSTPGYYAYLKISEGCDNHCTYCIIPSLRGKHRSRSLESLVAEAETLAARGVRELLVVAQDTSIYGRDLYGEPKLDLLLSELCKVEGIQWIRLLYCYPETLTEAVMEVMAREPKICNYIDMPIQHAHDEVLKRMGRRSSRALLEEKVRLLRQKVPGICIRTTLIAGFPGETEEAFESLKDFVTKMQFDRLGVFAYSQEEGTPAAKLPDQLPEAEKKRRRDELLAIQKEISAAACAREVGRTLSVLVEGRLPEERTYCTRSYKDAPDIDGLVFVETDATLMSGELVEVTITGAYDYDLIGELTDGNESAQ